MLRLVSSFLTYSVHAIDGEAGQISNAYFDDRSWVIRHFIIDTGTWLPGRRVLLDPSILKSIDDRKRRVTLGATRREVRALPSPVTDPSVSLQKHMRARNSYGWIALESSAPLGYLPWMPEVIDDDEMADRLDESRRDNPHMRSGLEVLRYRMENADREIGQIEDLVFDDVSWRIESVVVYVTLFSPARKMVIPTRHIKKIRWLDKSVTTALSVRRVEMCEPFISNRFE
jgi:hypothetical protein